MKLSGLVSEGIEAKIAIQEGEVTVNGEVETRRGRKLVPGDVFAWQEKEVVVEGPAGNEQNDIQTMEKEAAVAEKNSMAAAVTAKTAVAETEV